MINAVLALLMVTSSMNVSCNEMEACRCLLADGKWLSLYEDGPPMAGKLCWVIVNHFYIQEAYWNPRKNAWISPSNGFIFSYHPIEYWRYPEFI